MEASKLPVWANKQAFNYQQCYEECMVLTAKTSMQLDGCASSSSRHQEQTFKRIDALKGMAASKGTVFRVHMSRGIVEKLSNKSKIDLPSRSGAR